MKCKKEVEELYDKIKIWFPEWWKTLVDKHSIQLEKRKIWKRENRWRYIKAK